MQPSSWLRMAFCCALLAGGAACGGDSEQSVADATGEIDAADAPTVPADTAGDAGMDVGPPPLDDADAGDSTDGSDAMPDDGGDVAPAPDAADVSDVADTDTDSGVGDALVVTLDVPTAVYVGVPVELRAEAAGGLDEDPVQFAWTIEDVLSLPLSDRSAVTAVFDVPGPQSVVVEAQAGESSGSLRTTIEVLEQPTVRDAEVRGTVRSAGGGPLADAVILDGLSGEELALTDAQGHFEAAVPAAGAAALRVERPGFTSQVVAVTAQAFDAGLSVVLQRRAAPQLLADAAAGGTVAGEGGLSLVFPAGALVDEATGEALQGPVTVLATALDMSDPSQGPAFPGRYDGVDATGVVEPIASLGVVEVELRQGDRPVQIAPGQTATLDIPVSSGEPGDVVPLWSLDEGTGLWRHEGTGTVVATDEGLVLRSTVSHFSWWNADVLASGLFANVELDLVLPDGSPFTVDATASLQARVTAVNLGTPARHFERGMPLPAGRIVLPDPLLLPFATATFVEVVVWDEERERLWIGQQEVLAVEGEPLQRFEMAEVGSDERPLLALPGDGESVRVVLSDETPRALFSVDVPAGETRAINFAAAGMDRSVQVRQLARDGRVLRQWRVSSAEELTLAFRSANSVEQTRYVELRNSNTGLTELTLSGEAITLQALQPGASVLVPVFFPLVADVLLQGETVDGVFVAPVAFDLNVWQTRLTAPNGRELGLFASYVRDSPAPDIGGTFWAFDNGRGYRARLQGSAPPMPERSDVELAWYRPVPQGLPLGPGPALDRIAELGGPEEAPDPFMMHRYDVLVPLEHALHVSVQRLRPTTDGDGWEPDIGAAPAVIVVDAALERIGKVAVDPADAVSYQQAQPPFRSTEDIVSSFAVLLPAGERGAYRVVAEVVPEDPDAAIEGPLRIGDCEGANFRHLAALANAFFIIGPRSVELCPTDDMAHLLPNDLRGMYSLRGTEAGRPERTRIHSVETGNLEVGLPTTDPIEATCVLADFAFHRTADTPRGLMVVGGGVRLEIADVDLVMLPDSGSSDWSAISTRLSGSELDLQRVRVNAANARALRSVHAAVVTIDESEFYTGAYSAIEGFDPDGNIDLTIRNSRIECNGRSQCVWIDAGGSFVMEDNEFINRNPVDTNTHLLSLRHQRVDTERKRINIQGNDFLIEGDGGRAVVLSLAGTNADVRVNGNRMEFVEGGTGTGIARPIEVSAAGGAVGYVLEVFNNRILGFRDESEFNNINGYPAPRIHHNSIVQGFSPLRRPPLLEFTGPGTVFVANNALVGGEPDAARVAVRALTGTAVEGTNNLFWNVSATPWSLLTESTISGDVVADPQWDGTTLEPMEGSPLVDAGAPLDEPDQDTDGTARPQGPAPDIGAWEMP